MRYYKMWLFALAVSALSLPSLTSAIMYKFELGGLSSHDVSHVHFNAWGNDFGGLFVWRDATSAQAAGLMDVKIQSQTDPVLQCSKQIKGFYFNSQRGERLWPLDTNTAEILWYFGLDMQGGLYTSCISWSALPTKVVESPYGIYGHLQHTYQGKTYDLVAGAQYADNKIDSTSNLHPSLQRFDNKFPLGIIYDYNGGLGLVGCQSVPPVMLEEIAALFSQDDISRLFEMNPTGEYPVLVSPHVGKLDCKNIGLSLDQLLILKIQGLVGLSTDLGSEITAILGNEGDAKTQYFSSVNLNNAVLINYAKRKAEELCRGKWSSTFSTSPSSDVICWDWGNRTQKVTPSLPALQNKTIIVRNGSIELDGAMTETTPPLNIFIDKWKLLINSGLPASMSFNNQAFPDRSNSVASGVFFKGNFIVNGLVGFSPKLDLKTPEGQLNPGFHRVIIHGKFTSLNTYDTNTAKNRSQQVRDMVGSVGLDDIDLTQVFAWRCNYGIGSDGTGCPLSEYQRAPLVIINQNYPSALIE